MTEYSIHTINLAGLPLTQGIRFTVAQWWDPTSPLAVVTCLHYSRLTKLRMDLDKMTFIDHLDDPEADEAVQSLANSIWQIIVEERFPIHDAVSEPV